MFQLLPVEVLKKLFYLNSLLMLDLFSTCKKLREFAINCYLDHLHFKSKKQIDLFIANVLPNTKPNEMVKTITFDLDSGELEKYKDQVYPLLHCALLHYSLGLESLHLAVVHLGTFDESIFEAARFPRLRALSVHSFAYALSDDNRLRAAFLDRLLRSLPALTHLTLTGVSLDDIHRVAHALRSLVTFAFSFLRRDDKAAAPEDPSQAPTPVFQALVHNNPNLTKIINTRWTTKHFTYNIPTPADWEVLLFCQSKGMQGFEATKKLNLSLLSFQNTPPGDLPKVVKLFDEPNITKIWNLDLYDPIKRQLIISKDNKQALEIHKVVVKHLRLSHLKLKVSVIEHAVEYLNAVLDEGRDLVKLSAIVYSYVYDTTILRNFVGKCKGLQVLNTCPTTLQFIPYSNPDVRHLSLHYITLPEGNETIQGWMARVEVCEFKNVYFCYGRDMQFNAFLAILGTYRLPRRVVMSGILSCLVVRANEDVNALEKSIEHYKKILGQQHPRTKVIWNIKVTNSFFG